jgi:hypothetical protein
LRKRDWINVISPQYRNRPFAFQHYFSSQTKDLLLHGFNPFNATVNRDLRMSGLLLFLMIFLTGCMENNMVMSAGNRDKILVEERNVKGIFAHITTNDSVRHLVNHPAFKGFGKYLLPGDNGTDYYNTPLNKVSSLLPYHNHVDPNLVVGAINHMIDEINEGKTIFYDFYSEKQKREDPTKESTDLFFFRGNRELRLLLSVREEAFPMSVPSMKAFHTLPR